MFKYSIVMSPIKHTTIARITIHLCDLTRSINMVANKTTQIITLSVFKYPLSIMRMLIMDVSHKYVRGVGCI